MIICYTENGQKLWAEVQGNSDEALARFIANAKPGVQVNAVFSMDDDRCGNEMGKYKNAFDASANRYGLRTDDWNREVMLGGRAARIRGVVPGRRKYVIRVFFPADNEYRLYTAASVRRAIEAADRAKGECYA